MKRMLIIDDEHHIVNWLSELFERQSDLDLDVYKAYSSIDALSILDYTKIDIVLLDIKMPVMDGLQLSKKILTTCPNCRIIFLTAHNSFDYIYYATKQPNTSYLLKTESDENIINAVANAINSINSEIENLQLLIQSRANEIILNYVIQRDLLSSLFNGNSLNIILNHELGAKDFFPLRFDAPVFLLYGNLYEPISPFNSDNLKDIFLQSAQIVEQILQIGFRYSIHIYNETTIIWLLQPTPDIGSQNPQFPFFYIKDSLDDFIDLFQKKASFDITLFLYHKSVEWDNVYEIFLSIKKFVLLLTPQQSMQSYAMIYNESIDALSDTSAGYDHLLRECHTLITQITLPFNYKEYRRISHILKQISFTSHNIYNINYPPLVELYQRILSLLLGQIHMYHLENILSTEIVLHTHYFKNWSEAFVYLDKLADSIFNPNNSLQLDKNSEICFEIKKYIQDHLSDDLTLTTLSNVVNYNCSYTSRVFKTTTGLKLSNYITMCRINKAKELLLSTDDSLQNIAKNVGLDTSQYLNMIFKKEVGVTPGEFRRRNKSNLPPK